MPILRKSFDNGNFSTRETDRSNHPVYVLLKNNQNFAYTVKEIVARTKKKEETVRGILGVLVKSKLVVHKSPYFAWKVERHVPTLTDFVKKQRKETSRKKTAARRNR